MQPTTHPAMIITYLIIFYLTINLLGIVIEKLRIPKIYSALFLGIAFSNTSQVLNLLSLNSTKLLSQAGMFSLLFLLGYGLDIHQLKQQSRLIFKITASVIASEITVGLLLLHFFFQVPWLLAGIIAISFATVGEVAILPLLKEFKLLKSHLGQTILGVAILDDVAEILAFILLFTLITGLQTSDLLNQILPLTAIILGVIFKSIQPTSSQFDQIINLIALYILGPIFFFTAGTEAKLDSLVNNFFVILAITLLIKTTKITSAYLASHKQLGTKKSLVLGVSLGIKFSTSIIILILLLNQNLISQELFSILIGIKVLFKLIVPIVLSILLDKWNLELIKANQSTRQLPAS